MSTEIHLIYTATAAVVSPEREGEEQTLIITANANDMPVPRVDGRTQLSRRGLRKATTVHGRWYQGTISTPYIASTERLYWREYLESTAEEEPHRLIHPNFMGWDADVSDLTIYRPLNSGKFSRFDLGDEYRASIEWRQVGG